MSTDLFGESELDADTDFAWDEFLPDNDEAEPVALEVDESQLDLDDSEFAWDTALEPDDPDAEERARLEAARIEETFARMEATVRQRLEPELEPDVPELETAELEPEPELLLLDDVELEQEPEAEQAWHGQPEAVLEGTFYDQEHGLGSEPAEETDAGELLFGYAPDTPRRDDHFGGVFDAPFEDDAFEGDAFEEDAFEEDALMEEPFEDDFLEDGFLLVDDRSDHDRALDDEWAPEQEQRTGIDLDLGAPAGMEPALAVGLDLEPEPEPQPEAQRQPEPQLATFLDETAPQIGAPSLGGGVPAPRRRVGTAAVVLACVAVVLGAGLVAGRVLHHTPAPAAQPQGAPAAGGQRGTAASTPSAPSVAASLQTATDEADSATTTALAGLSSLPSFPTPTNVASVVNPYVASLLLYEAYLSGATVPASVRQPTATASSEIRNDLTFLDTINGLPPIELGAFIGQFQSDTTQLQNTLGTIERALSASGGS